MRTPTILDMVLLTGLAAIWGSAFLVIKIAVHEIPPATVAASRVLIAAVLIYLYMRSRGLSLPRNGQFWRLISVTGLLSMALPFALISWGEQHIDSGLAAILMATGPLIALVLSHFFSPDDRFTSFKLLGVIVGFAGVMMIIGFDALSGLGDNIPAQLATIGAALCYGGSGILVRKVNEKSNTVTTAAVLITATLWILPVSLLLDRPWEVLPQSSADALFSLLYLGIVPTAIAFVLRFHIIREVGYSFASFVGYLVPVFGVIWGWIFLDERLPATTMGALVLILAGVATSRLSKEGLTRWYR